MKKKKKKKKMKNKNIYGFGLGMTLTLNVCYNTSLAHKKNVNYHGKLQDFWVKKLQQSTTAQPSNIEAKETKGELMI